PEWARPQHEWLLIATDWDWFGFRRGFLQGVVFSDVKRFLRSAAKIFAAEPITHIWLGDANGLPQLASSPEFLRLGALEFGNYVLGDWGVTELSKLPPLPRLRRLDLYKQNFGDGALKALLKWPGLATVEYLNLGFNYIRMAGVRALMTSRY